MEKIFLVGTGGFIGAVLRYFVSGYVQEWTKHKSFPFGTLAVNLIGCLVIGLLSQIAETRGVFTGESRSMLFIGVLGAFTTFSSFSNETINLMQDGKSSLAMMSVGAHLLLGLAAVRVGRNLAYHMGI